jgi:hypothetical protein
MRSAGAAGQVRGTWGVSLVGSPGADHPGAHGGGPYRNSGGFAALLMGW